ncbi:protein ECT2 isoform X2 [Bradysia coprophila]|uniref:protein ECT2 isoform X2 n=1 Tax=Bradysia coprophila TaxID=38358 RepID=UPI00187D9BC8|nr:protein ECT2 isoform X2 [Bradysia coprophila]
MMNKLSNEDLPANSANADHADTITDEQKANNDIASKKRICLVGAVANDSATKELAETFGVPVETSDTGIEKLSEREWITYFIIRDFSGPVFEDLQKSIHEILSPIALQHATKDGLIPHGNHPIYNYSMQGVVACFAGLRKKDQLIQLLNQIHWMGGSVRDNIMNSKVTHLICEKIPRLTREDDERRKINKYKYAIAFGLAVIKPDWVNEAWEQRDVNRFSPINADFTRPHKLKAFEGHKICFLGFATEEHDHMIDVLNRNGGVHATIDDPECTHVIISNTADHFSENQSPLPLTPTNPSHSPFKNIATEVLTEEDPEAPVEHENICENSNAATHPKIVHNSPAPDGIVLHLNETNEFIDPNDLSPILKCKPDDATSLFGDGLDNIEEENSNESEQRDGLKRKRDSFDNISIDSMAPSFSSSRKSKLRRTGSITQTLKRRLSFVGNPITKLRSRRNSVDPNASLNSITSVDSVCNDSIKSYVKDRPMRALRSMMKGVGKDSVKTPKSTKLFSKIKSSFVERTPDKHVADVVDFKTPRLPTPSTVPMSQRVTENEQQTNSVSIFTVINKSTIATTPVRKACLHSTTNEPDSSICVASEPNVVVDDRATQSKPEPKNSETVIVKSDWFWYTIQNGYADEKDHLFENYLERICNVSKTDRRDSLPNRKRKLLHLTPADSTPRGLLKRRSSVSDVGLLSGSLLDYTASPNVKNDIKELDISTEPKKKTMRYNHFMDLFGTESNYVDILNTITTLFYEPLKEMADTKNALINISEIKSIFNNFSPIYDVHKEMLDKFRELQEGWSEECLIGKIILDHREALIKAYPPYVNFFEQMKETLAQCDTQNPRFHAFLKINQTKAECGRQSLQDLMIRPVQRLPSISLLISDILKHTPKTNPDFKELEQALKAIKEVMTYINEDKRKTEGRLALFDIFNDIDNCPPDLVSSHRRFVSKCEVTELSNNLSGRDDPLMLFLFTDYMEICKIKKHRFNSAKSPTFGTTGLNTARVSHQKSYKHIKLLPLSSIAVVYDVQDSPRAFALPHKDKMYSFSICDDIEKIIYLKSLCKQLAENACRADAEQFLRSYESHELGIDVSDINVGTLKKAFNYARTRLKVTRAFSFHKTPMKMKRSATTSPIFGSTNSLTPATQLAQMKLASCTNINEVGETDEDEETSHRNHLVAPHSVLPTRKSKSATLSMAALRRL